MLLSVLSGVTVIGVVIVGRELRPLADDYCLAMWASDGLFDGIGTVFTTWAGDLVLVTSNILLAGLPLAFLPWQVASLLPFMLGATSVAFATWALLGALGAFGVRLRTGLLLIPTVMVVWWSYWWIPVRFPDAVNPLDAVVDLELAASVTFWQNINTAYVIPLSVWVMVCVLLWRRVDRPLGAGVVLWAVAGVAMGLSGPVLALTFMAVLVLLGVVLAALRSLTRRRAVRGATLLMGTLGGVIITALSPGTRIRSTFLVDTPYSTMNGLPDLAVWTVQGTARAWWGMLVGWPSVFVFLAAVLLGLLLGPNDRMAARRLGITGGSLLLLALILQAASVAAEAFSYPAFWHVIAPGLVMFWALFCLGWGAANALAGRAAATWSAAVGAAVVLLVGAGLAVTDMGVRIADRYDAWAQGPAPVGWVPDTNAGWVADCEREFGFRREQPDRGTGG